VERDALLAEPVVEHGLGPRPIGHDAHAAANVLGEESLTHGADVVISGVAIGQLDPGLFEGGHIDQLGYRIGAERNAIELAIDLAAFELVFIKAFELESSANEFVERS